MDYFANPILFNYTFKKGAGLFFNEKDFTYFIISPFKVFWGIRGGGGIKNFFHGIQCVS